MPRKSRSSKQGGTTNTRAIEKFNQVDAAASNTERVVENDAHLLRQSISSLFRAGSTLRSYRFATRKIEPNLGTEQLWSQLQILYAPTIKKMEGAFESTSNFEELATKLKESEAKAKKQQQQTKQNNHNNSQSSIKNKKASLAAAKRNGGQYVSSSDDEDYDEDEDDHLENTKNLSLMDMMKNRKDGKLPSFVQDLDRQEQERILKKKLAKESYEGTSRVGNYAFGLGNGGSSKGGKRNGGPSNEEDEDDVMMQQEFGGAEHNEDDVAENNIFASNNSRRRRQQNEFDRRGGYDDDDAEFDADDLLDDDADDEELARRAKQQARGMNKNEDDDADAMMMEDDEEDFFDEDEEDLDAMMMEDEEEEEDEENFDDDNEDNQALKEMYGAGDETFNAQEFEDDDGDLPDGDDMMDMDEDDYKKFKRAYDEEESLEDEEDRKIESELVPKTAFEIAEKERQNRIRQVEQDRLAGNWEMAGEVAAIDRPRDALLNTDLIMEHAMTTAPVITESLTLKLEERLKRRILANSFDDVIRKNPKLVHFDEKDAKVLRQEQYEEQSQKSKASLVDLYEKEFLEKQRKSSGAADGEQAEPLTQVEQDELKALQQWRRISQHLDALSNFFFTPKPAANDLDARVRAVQDQAPAISVESKGMFALSREKVLAPQDVFRPKKGQAAAMMTSKEEMTPGEKRNLRAAQKRTFQVSKSLEDKRQDQKKKARDAKLKQREEGVRQD